MPVCCKEAPVSGWQIIGPEIHGDGIVHIDHSLIVFDDNLHTHGRSAAEVKWPFQFNHLVYFRTLPWPHIENDPVVGWLYPEIIALFKVFAGAKHDSEFLC